jgi:hypothetical protein
MATVTEPEAARLLVVEMVQVLVPASQVVLASEVVVSLP